MIEWRFYWAAKLVHNNTTAIKTFMVTFTSYPPLCTLTYLRWHMNIWCFRRFSNQRVTGQCSGGSQQPLPPPLSRMRHWKLTVLIRCRTTWRNTVLVRPKMGISLYVGTLYFIFWSERSDTHEWASLLWEKVRPYLYSFGKPASTSKTTDRGAELRRSKCNAIS